MTFSEQLKAHRERLGLTQAELAALLGVPSRTHWEWESGKTTPHAITQEGALDRLTKAKRLPRRNENAEAVATASNTHG